MKNWIIFLVLLIAIGCDTDSTIDPPDNNFFLKYYGGEGNQEGVDAVLNADGTITLFGTTEADVGGSKLKQLYLVNIEQNGQIIWENTITTTSNAIAKDIELTNDGRLVIVADLNKSLGNNDIFIMSLTLTGAMIDSTSTGFVFVSPSPLAGQPSDETAVSVSQTNDGFIVSGSTSRLDLKPPSPPGTIDSRDALHLRYFDDLTIYPNTWRQAHGPGEEDIGVKVIQVSSSQFYFFGYSNENGDFNPYILGLGQDGETNAAYNFFPGNLGTNEYISSVVLSPPQSGDGFLVLGVSVGATTDLYIAKMRQTLNFLSTDFQSQKNLTADLGANVNFKTSAFPSLSSGFLILANDKKSGVQNFHLNKIGSDGTPVWQNPIIFGGEQDDEIGSVLELPDGSIGIIGTFAIGQDGEKKMTFIKVNKEGKFLK